MDATLDINHEKPQTEEPPPADVERQLPTEDNSSSSGSDSDDDDEEDDVPQVEWLATSRQKRSTAGNRLHALLQQAEEDPEDDLALLFNEDDAGEDAGFEDAGHDSDVQMDSSSDDEDPAADDDLEGEKALERQEKAERQSKKRKLQDKIPFVKKRVKIDPTAPPQAPAPKPKKKSERASWIPTTDDLPTRASARGTTRQSKEQLHAQMVDREIKRIKQLKNMEKAAAAKKAREKPALTQADRLAEAARIEKANSRSLSRWEESEMQREEEQKAKLAALKNRHLDGPVITWWSGLAEWVGGHLRQVGKNLTIEEPKEKPITKKRKAAEMEEDGEKGKKQAGKEPIGLPGMVEAEDPKEGSSKDDTLTKSPADAVQTLPISSKPPPLDPDQILPISSSKSPPQDPDQTLPVSSSKSLPQDPDQTLPISSSKSPPRDLESSTAKPASPKPSTSNPNSEDQEYPPPIQPQVQLPPRSSVLAPPPGLPIHAPHPPPNFNQNHSYGKSQYTLAPPPPALDGSAPLPGLGYGYNFQPQPPPYPSLSPSQLYSQPPLPPNQPPLQQQPHPEQPPAPPAIEHAARNYLILQNFEDSAIKDKNVQTEIIFGRKFQKLPTSRTKHHHAVCCITHYPAKYRDPSTGLAYANAFAYGQIQKLKRGEYKWSKLVGAYVGLGTGVVARGVPGRFKDGLGERETPKEPKEWKAGVSLGQALREGGGSGGAIATGSGGVSGVSGVGGVGVVGGSGIGSASASGSALSLSVNEQGKGKGPAV